jgi:hypothetical protein
VDRGKPYEPAVNVYWSSEGIGFDEIFLAMSTPVPSIITLPPDKAAD